MACDILIVDDEKDICQLIGDTLEDEGYRVRFVHDGPSAVEAARWRCPTLIILDIWLGDSQFDGVRALEMILKDHPCVPIIMMSGHGTIETAVDTIRKGAYDFVEKPFKMDRLLLAIQRALEAYRLRQENEALKERSDFYPPTLEEEIVPASLRPLLKRVASSESRVMLQGEIGVGKSCIARMIHALSSRSDAPFIHLNCATADDDALEKKLFGFESEERIVTGALERAHQGVLFLDQVDLLSLSGQKKLSKALQSQSFTRVGGQTSTPFDSRLISSVTCDMESELQKGTFLEDLHFLLCVTPIAVPALRDRLGELENLVGIFSRYAAKAHSLKPKVFSKETLVTLQSYAWPGNLKQLKNIIDWLYVMQEALLIMPEHLPTNVIEEAPLLSLEADKATRLISLPLKEARMEFERDYLKAQVSRFSGNISLTAQSIGMERSALHRKLKSLKISRVS